MDFDIEQLKKKIIYRSQYRGTKEMDMLLSSFVKQYINILNVNELNDLNNLLSLEDEILYNFYQHNRQDNKLIKNRVLSLFKSFKI